MLRLALGLEGSPLAGGISVEGGGWAADLLAAAADVSRRAGRARPTGFVGELRSYQAEALAWLGFLDAAGLGGCLALDMGLGKTPTMLAHLLAGAGDGPALVIAPPAVVGNWAAEAARFTPDLRVVVHHGAQPRRARRDRGRGRRRRRRRSPPTAPRCATSRRSPTIEWARVVLDEAQAIKNPANDTSQQLRRIPRAHARRAHRHADRERPRRPLGDPRLHQPRPRRHRGRSSSRDCRATATSTRVDGRGRAARAQRHPRVPAHQGRAGDRRRAARPDRRARPLRDDARADRPVPGGARQARRRHRPARGRASRARARSSPRSPRSSRSATTRRVPATTTDRSPGARASSRGSRRSSTRCSRPARRVLVFTHFAEWGVRARRAPHRAHRHAGRLLPRRAVAHRARPHDRRLPDRRGPGRARAVAEGRRHRAEPHRREPRRALRPLVEPRGRGPGPRPRVAHRPDPHRHLPPAGVPRHRRRAGRRGRRRQAPHRRPGAAEVELARRPRQRAAARRARHPPRRRAHRRRSSCRSRGRHDDRAPPPQGSRASRPAPHAAVHAQLLGQRRHLRRRAASCIRPADDPTAMLQSLGLAAAPGPRDGRGALLRRGLRAGRGAGGRARRGVRPARRRRRRRRRRSRGRRRERRVRRRRGTAPDV